MTEYRWTIWSHLSLPFPPHTLTSGACGYQKDGAGICNDTIFGYPFEPLAQLVSDAPSAPVNYKTVTMQIIPDKDSGAFKNKSWNRGLSRTASLLIFVGSILTIGALAGGLIKHRLSFLLAAACSGISAFFLMVGAAIWTSIIAKDAALKVVKVEGKVALGIFVTGGPSLCEFILKVVADGRSHLGRVRVHVARRRAVRHFVLHVPQVSGAVGGSLARS